jgi:hypothetical protein
VLLLFTTVVAPLLVTRARVEATCFAVFNEDATPVSKQFIDYVANSKSFDGIVYIFCVDSLEQGRELVRTNEASGLLYIPAGFYEAMSGGEDVTLEIYGSELNILECSLVLTAVETALNTAGGAQNALGVLRRDVLELGASEEGADQLYDEMLSCGIHAITNRRPCWGRMVLSLPPADIFRSSFICRPC